jgi:Uma2 family endonuclease
MATVQIPHEQRVVLRNVGWETYERLLDGRDGRAPRFTYDRGALEIMSPITGEHEEYGRGIEFLVRVLAGELGVKYRAFGSMTMRRRDQEAGHEADACFYTRNLQAIRGKRRPDLEIDPAPDLAVEVDITSPSLDKLAVYARLGIGEVWRYDGNRREVRIHLLRGDAYTEGAESAIFAGVTADELTVLIRDVGYADSDEWERRVRDWARGLRERTPAEGRDA